MGAEVVAVSFWRKCKTCGRPVLRELAGSFVYCSRVCRDAPEPREQAHALVNHPQEPTVRASRKQEREVAEILGGRVVRASGALPGKGGDVEAGRFLVEAKRTDKRQFTFKLETWQKIEDEAALAGKTPAMVLDMGGRRLAILELALVTDLLSAK